MNSRFLFTLMFLVDFLVSFSQEKYPVNYFISPVDFPMILSGTFGELRSNHFHSGIDITTQGKEGKPVYASAAGYVSRIKISAYGYGKALYITHPNGFTTVYAHLQGFNPAIDKWLKSEQYKLEKFEVDLFPDKDELPVLKKEIVAWSGNSGSSEGPHLHFEIRESKTEIPVDPQLFGFDLKDYIRPTITAVRIYPETNYSSIEGKCSIYTTEVSGWGPVYRLKKQDTLRISGKFSIGLECFDLMNGNKNKNGISRYSVYIDSTLKFDWQVEKFAFSETRYINSFIDYSEYYHHKERFIRTVVDRNNTLSMYRHAESNGIFEIVSDSAVPVKIVISDAHKNESIVTFFLKADTARIKKSDKKPAKNTLNCQKDNSYTKDGIKIDIPANSLYHDIDFELSVSDKKSYTYSPVYQIHQPGVPVHNYIDLTFSLDTVYTSIAKKLTLTQIWSDKAPLSIGGSFENGNFKAKIREFGSYTLMADTVPPVIKPLNISDNKNIANQSTIKMVISDSFSGIKSYRATLNNKWILMDYDPKSNLLVYRMDEKLVNGTNNFVLLVEDYCGNTNNYKACLIFQK